MGKTEQREATGVRAGRGTKSLYCQSIVGHKVERGTWKVKTIQEGYPEEEFCLGKPED